MQVSPLMLRHQGPMLKALGSVAVSAMRPVPSDNTLQTPGPELQDTVTPRPAELVDQYLEWSGGDPVRYQHTLPPHLFPQWGFPLLSKTLQGLPYKLTGVLNQGCRMQVQAPLPRHKPLQLRARLEDVREEGGKVRLHQRLITGTEDAPEALIADVFAVVLLGKGGGSKKKTDVQKPEFELIDEWAAPLNDGRNFAFLTGDLNPIHWIAPYAKLAGFKRQILHGFGSLARTYESVADYMPTKQIVDIDVRFVKPLVLPAKTKVFLQKKTTGGKKHLELQDAESNICMAGSVKLR